MEAEAAVSGRFALREQTIKWHHLSLFFGGLVMVLLSIGFVSPRSGQDLMLNMRNWASFWLLMWSVALFGATTATGVCQFMRWQLLNPKPGERPWFWYEAALPPVTIGVWILIVIRMNAPMM